MSVGIIIPLHDAKIISAMLRGYAKLIDDADIASIPDAGIRMLLIEERNQAIIMRKEILLKIGIVPAE